MRMAAALVAAAVVAGTQPPGSPRLAGEAITLVGDDLRAPAVAGERRQ